MSKLLRIFDKFFPQSHAGLRQKKREGVVRTGYEVPKNPVFMRVYGHFPNWRIGFATLLQHVMSREPFATDEITANGYAVMS